MALTSIFFNTGKKMLEKHKKIHCCVYCSILHKKYAIYHNYTNNYYPANLNIIKGIPFKTSYFISG